MPNQIPQIPLTELLERRTLLSRHATAYNLSVSPPGRPLPMEPYRASFYAVGLCLAGTVELRTDQADYHVAPGSLVLLGPQALRQWHQQSADYYNEALFFTEEFFSQPFADPTQLQQFAFFDAHATRVLPLATEEATQVSRLLQEVRYVLGRPSPYQADLVRSYAAALLYLAADSYSRRFTAPTHRPRRFELVAQFQQLVAADTPSLRPVAAYASQLCVTSKHLSETVKAATGKTAGEWIAGQLLREARRLLWQTDRSVSQVADMLGFSDASAFGKFFRRHTGQTPAAYQQQCPL
ncbi:helix-turn-helix domain-containing protein [Hymenobacter sp. APR13]|uniref:helix-turn-helix domain-containing protein n=1 Tax=Hymenobacter sp. APR13 TaxID=1356852 RepID=UPI0004E0A399|nr:helix-turn-helix domain-containing protein [Hymenobacter sp. APR13]AII54401.1 hypothetical protein N008_20740 [Hymenobacter sp. APR13]